MKNKTLFIALFLCEASPAWMVAHFIEPNTILSSLVVVLLGISLLFSWFFADKNNKLIKNIGYAGIFLGLAFSVSYFNNYAPSMGILIVALSMLLGINISLRERRMVAYLLIFSFMLFLYASSIVFNKYSIVSVVVFTFSFFTVVIADYYLSREHLQSLYSYETKHGFFGTTFLLVLIVFIFGAVLYYFLPQPKALHYGILPFGGTKEYKGLVGEEDENNKNYKETTKQLPNYTVDAKETKNVAALVVFDEKKAMPEKTKKIDRTSETNAKKRYDSVKEKSLKSKNKKAYYSSVYTEKDANASDILFEVKGKDARFLRGDTYGSFDGKSWKKVLTKMYTIKQGSRDSYHYWNGKEWQRRTRSFVPNDFYYNEYFTQNTDHYTITVKGRLAGKPIIYTPLGLLRLQFPSDTFYEDASRVIYAPSQLEIDTYYTASVESEGYYGYDAMSYADVWYKKIYSKPGYAMDPRVDALARELTKDCANAFEKAQAIVTYFKKDYLYKHTSIEHSIHDQTLSEMLFETKVANALQFNTALIMMLRSSGEYARLATGYAPSEYNQATNSYVVERKNKAVWTEIFVKERGWVGIHAADDIPFEGEEIPTEPKEIAWTQAQTIFLGILLVLAVLVLVYHGRKYMWSYLAKSRIQNYAQKSDRDFVIATYKEVEKYYGYYQKGPKPSCTLQEYKNHMKVLQPEYGYIIEYVIFYSNQAIYRGGLDPEFDRERYLESALFLIDQTLEAESFQNFIRTKLA